MIKAILLLYSSKKSVNFNDKELKQIKKIKKRAPIQISDDFEDRVKHFRDEETKEKHDDDDKVVKTINNINTDPAEIGMETLRDANRWDNIERNESISSKLRNSDDSTDRDYEENVDEPDEDGLDQMEDIKESQNKNGSNDADEAIKSNI